MKKIFLDTVHTLTRLPKDNARLQRFLVAAAKRGDNHNVIRALNALHDRDMMWLADQPVTLNTTHATAMNQAAKNDHADVVKTLIDAGAVVSILLVPEVAATASYDTVRRLAMEIVDDANEGSPAQDFSAHQKQEMLNKALSNAAGAGNLHVMELMLDMGADPKAHEAVKAAVKNGQALALDLLKENGADLSAAHGMLVPDTKANADVRAILGAAGVYIKSRERITVILGGDRSLARVYQEALANKAGKKPAPVNTAWEKMPLDEIMRITPPGGL